MTTSTYAFLVAVLVFGVTAGAAAGKPWAEELEWCAQDCGAFECPKEVLGLVVADPQTVLGAACPRQALISLARQAARAGQREKAFALARTCLCHDPVAQAGLEGNKPQVLEWLRKYEGHPHCGGLRQPAA
jgi:hypothetical protein